MSGAFKAKMPKTPGGGFIIDSGGMQVQTCPNCSKKLPDNAKFCDACGTRLSIDAACPACGAPAVPGAAFCEQCGKPLEPSPAAKAPAEGAAPGGRAGASLLRP